jgi:hypothetical protein
MNVILVTRCHYRPGIGLVYIYGGDTRGGEGVDGMQAVVWVNVLEGLVERYRKRQTWKTVSWKRERRERLTGTTHMHELYLAIITRGRVYHAIITINRFLSCGTPYFSAGSIFQ